MTIKLQSSNEKTTVNNKVYASFYPDWNHVARGDKTIAVLDSVVIKTGGSHQITDDTRALIDTVVILKNYGTSMVIKGVLEDERRSARYIAGAAAPLSSDMPTFLPGGEKRVFVGMEKKTGKMTYTIMYEKKFDNNADNVMLRGETKF